MKKLALFLLVITIALCGFALYLRLGAQLYVSGASVVWQNASEDQGKWSKLYMELMDNTFQGKKLSSAELSNSADFEFRTYSVTLRNLGLLKAEWISMSVRPEASDIIEYGESRGFTLNAYSRGTIPGTVLARAGSPVERVVTIRYYVYGHLFEIETLVK